MRNYTKILASGAIALSVLPFAASAHGIGADVKAIAKSDHKGGISAEVKSFIQEMKKNREVKHDKSEIKSHFVSGSVTAIGTNSLTITGSDSKIYTVDTTNAKIQQPFNKTAVSLSAVKVGDKVQVIGTVSTVNNVNTITAKLVIDMPANTHPAMTTGTVTAVNGNTVTVQNTRTGVVSNVTVNTDANTVVTKDDQAATTADVTVGSNVKVKGLWNETLNVLNAIKINIRTLFTK